MTARRRNLMAALVVFTLGVVVIVEALQHDMGDMARIGPGFFPLCLGAGLLLMAGLIVFDPFVDDAEEPFKVAWRPLIAIGSAILFFALTIENIGMLPSAAGLIVIAAFANRKPNLKKTLVLAIVLPVVLAVVFVHGLQMSIKMIAW